MDRVDKMDVQEVKKQLQEQLMVQTFQEMVDDMTEKCFQMCVKKPGASLDNYEQRCIGNCMDRYIDSYNLVTKIFTSRLSTNQN